MRLAILGMYFLSATAEAAVFIEVTEEKTATTRAFVADIQAKALRETNVRERRPLTQISRFTVVNGELAVSGRELAEANEILFQCAVEGFDIAIIRDGHNSFSTPLRVISALAGHPIQVSTIKLIAVRDGKVFWERQLAREPSSYQWTATVGRG
jgi:uncharacterized protein (DUF2336 family)